MELWGGMGKIMFFSLHSTFLRAKNLLEVCTRHLDCSYLNNGHWMINLLFILIPHNINLRSEKDRLIAGYQNTYPETPFAPRIFCITTFYKCSSEDCIFQEKLKTLVYAKLGEGGRQKVLSGEGWIDMCLTLPFGDQLAPSQKSRRNHRFYVWTESVCGVVFVPCVNTVLVKKKLPWR